MAIEIGENKMLVKQKLNIGDDLQYDRKNCASIEKSYLSNMEG